MRKFLIALVLATVVAACGESTSPIGASIAGTYTLRTINGSPLPYIIAQVGNDKAEFVDDQVTLSDGGTYTENGHQRLTQNGAVTVLTVVDAGTYTRAGTSVTFRSNSDPTPIPATVNGNSLTVATPGLSSVYTK